MAQVAAGCRRWTVSVAIIFLCFLRVNCIADNRNEVIFTQAEYTFAEDVNVIDSDEPLPNLVEICYSYLFLDEVVIVNILTFTTDGTATGESYCARGLHSS